MAQVKLENSVLQLVLDPDQGMNVLACFATRGDAWLPLMPDVRQSHIDLNAASFVMLPYSNRIENGRFVFDGHSFQLDRSEEHAIHGDTRQRSWKIVKQGETFLRGLFVSADHEDVNWPWPFSAEIDYRLEGNVLKSRIELINDGATPMPAGTGWHPYFSRALTRIGEPVLAQFFAPKMYPLDENYLPTGAPYAVPTELDFSAEKPLLADRPFDGCFYGYDGKGHISWPESGVRLDFSASPECPHFIFFNPPQKPYFAAEPLTHVNNAINLLARGDRTNGIVTLQPNQSLLFSFDLTVSFF